jgi:hypothetical protein
MSIITTDHKKNVEKLCEVMSEFGKRFFDMSTEFSMVDAMNSDVESFERLHEYFRGRGSRPADPFQLMHDCGAVCCLYGWERLVFGRPPIRFISFGLSAQRLSNNSSANEWVMHFFRSAVGNWLYGGRGAVWAHVVGGRDALEETQMENLTMEQGKHALRLSVLVVEAAERGLVGGTLTQADLYLEGSHSENFYGHKLQELVALCDQELDKESGVLTWEEVCRS